MDKLSSLVLTGTGTDEACCAGGVVSMGICSTLSDKDGGRMGGGVVFNSSRLPVSGAVKERINGSSV